MPLTVTRCEVLTTPVHEFVAAIWAEKDGGYSVIALHYPGVISQGDTIEEATANIGEAFLGMLDARRSHGEPMEYSREPVMKAPTWGTRVRISVKR